MTNFLSMKEPFLSEFKLRIEEGAGHRDIHDGSSVERKAVSSAFLDREIGRVDMHRKSLLPIVESIGQANHILDVGCSTGGTTIALATSEVLSPKIVIGVDPDRNSLNAAMCRKQAYMPKAQVGFIRNVPGEPINVSSRFFDLTVCVSVLEFIPTDEGRAFIVSEMRRATKIGGYIFLSTPNASYLREHHTGALLGNQVKRPGASWASSKADLLRYLGAGAKEIHPHAFYAEKLGMKVASTPKWITKAVSSVAPWTKLLVQVF